MKERTLTDWLPIATMVLGFAGCGVAMAVYRWNSEQLRLAFFVTSLATLLFLVLCLALSNRPRWPAAVGIIPLLLFWVTLCVPRTSDRNMSRMQMLNDAKQIGFAVAAFHDTYNHLPADVRDDAGKSILSWRVHLCPYLDQAPLYKQFDLKLPWDNPANRPFLEKNPLVYRTMIADDAEDFDKTPWQGFVGAGTAFDPNGRKLSLTNDFPDGASSTILIVEANQLVPWSKPADIAYGPNKPLPTFGRDYYREMAHPFPGMVRDPGFHAIMADGNVRFLSQDISEDVLRALIVRNDGKP